MRPEPPIKTPRSLCGCEEFCCTVACSVKCGQWPDSFKWTFNIDDFYKIAFLFARKQFFQHDQVRILYKQKRKGQGMSWRSLADGISWFEKLCLNSPMIGNCCLCWRSRRVWEFVNDQIGFVRFMFKLRIDMEYRFLTARSVSVGWGVRTGCTRG